MCHQNSKFPTSAFKCHNEVSINRNIKTPSQFCLDFHHVAALSVCELPVDGGGEGRDHRGGPAGQQQVLPRPHRPLLRGSQGYSSQVVSALKFFYEESDPSQQIETLSCISASHCLFGLQMFWHKSIMFDFMIFFRLWCRPGALLPARARSAPPSVRGTAGCWCGPADPTPAPSSQTPAPPLQLPQQRPRPQLQFKLAKSCYCSWTIIADKQLRY